MLHSLVKSASSLLPLCALLAFFVLFCAGARIPFAPERADGELRAATADARLGSERVLLRCGGYGASSARGRQKGKRCLADSTGLGPPRIHGLYCYGLYSYGPNGLVSAIVAQSMWSGTLLQAAVSGSVVP